MNGQRRSISKPIRKSDIMNDLLAEQKELKAAKSQETVSSVILGGVGILASVLSLSLIHI